MKQFPHEKLIQDNNINVAELNEDAKGLLKEFKQTMQGVKMQAAKTGSADIKPETEAKLRRLDKAICNEIFEFLDEEPITPAPPIAPKPPITNQPTNRQTPVTPTNEPPKAKKQNFVMGIGFYDED